MLLKFFVVAIFQLRPNLPTLKRTIGLKRGHLSESSFRSAGAIFGGMHAHKRTQKIGSFARHLTKNLVWVTYDLAGHKWLCLKATKWACSSYK